MAPTSLCTTRSRPPCSLNVDISTSFIASLKTAPDPTAKTRIPYAFETRPPQEPLLFPLRIHRFRKRQYLPDGPLSASPIDGPPPAVTPTLALHAPTLAPAPPNSTSNPPLSPLPQLSRVHPGADGALIATAVLLGVVILLFLVRFLLLKTYGRLATTVPSVVRKHFGTTAKVEQGLGFVMVDYEDSTWGTPPKKAEGHEDVEADARRDGDVSTKSVQPVQSDISARVRSWRHTMPTQPCASPTPIEDSSINNTMGRRQRSSSTPAFTMRRDYSTNTELYTISEGDEQDVSDVPMDTLSSSTGESEELVYSQEAADIAHALGLALQQYSSSISTLDSAPPRMRNRRGSLAVSAEDTVAAALALRAGMESVSVRARAPGRPRKASDASSLSAGAQEDGEEFSSAGSLSSSATSVGAAEEDEDEETVTFEVRRIEARSMEFQRGIVVSIATIADLHKCEDQIPQVVVSASPSFNECDFVDRGSLHACASDFSVSDFPEPPVLLDNVKTLSTSLTHDIEKSLSMALAGDPYFTRRVLSTPSRQVKDSMVHIEIPTIPTLETSEFDVYAL
ncbi:hypothetical protein BV25DRAFT_401395 [Artomyces pyxidatus]|uniref:Uncharacterized protein n=1 Tax=Artomyces pyxidatus TaxID=48021 RepID=A0ACB8T673_9AGAM|nr:hypothetical protein BV25DRAFT_401395 [Artomyces pyxidatus]